MTNPVSSHHVAGSTVRAQALLKCRLIASIHQVVLLCQGYEVVRHLGMESAKHPARSRGPWLGVVELAGVRLPEYVLVREGEAHDGVFRSHQAATRVAADRRIPGKLERADTAGRLRDITYRQRVIHHNGAQTGRLG